MDVLLWRLCILWHRLRAAIVRSLSWVLQVREQEKCMVMHGHGPAYLAILTG
jgi:hypothetical protein